MKKLFVIILVLSLSTAASAYSRPKLYYYDGDMPMITFMLNMMVAMGVIDRLPYGYGSDGRYGGGNSWNRWGGMGPYGAAGSYDRMRSFYPNLFTGSYGYWDDLDDYYNSGRSYGDQYWRDWSSVPYGSNMYGPRTGRDLFERKGCVPYCNDAEESSLDGVWLSSSGETLGIRGNTLMWSDGDNNYAIGELTVSGDRLLARLKGADYAIPYIYELDGNTLVTRDNDGVIRRFYRLPDTAPGS